MTERSPNLGLQQRRGRPTAVPVTTMEEIDEPRLQQSKKKSSSHSDNDGHVLIPLRQRSILTRYDVGPYIILYGLLVCLDNIENKSLSWIQSIAFPIAMISHLALVLSQQWRVTMRRFVGYATEKNDSSGQNWTHCWVQAPATESLHQDSEIVPISLLNDVVVVNFRDVIFRAALKEGADAMDTLFWKKDVRPKNSKPFIPKFQRLKYPVDLPLDFYKTWKGHETIDSIMLSQIVYGENSTRVELPPFFDLLGQQLLAPFFLFQLFCVFLWSLDEYWYYAIFTLFSLVMFECTVAFNRLKSLQRLRGTLRHPYPAYVFRHNLWIAVKTDELVPGDIVSLSEQPFSPHQHKQEKHVPADILLLDGNAVVDEALLTGESTPQLKGPLDTSSSASADLSNLDVGDSQHKQSVLFGGTVLVSHNNDNTNSLHGMPPPPDRGIVGFVLRTGFETAQGSLLRTMAHSSSQTVDGIHTRDTFVFVLLLLLCAVASAGMVLLEGWYDDTRNRFRLMVHVIIIVTSVVPPELPMELSLAVTNSVADLMKRCHVFCTEPFRIPWAGRVDVCCFDKTGTLTSDEMKLRGVRLASSDELMHPSSEEEQLPWPVLRVMAACHSLALGGRAQDGGVVGDPLERAVLNDAPFLLRRNDVVAVIGSEEPEKEIEIHHRFAFSSRLKRMTVLVTERGSDGTVWALTKGAPETIKNFLTQESTPSNYEEIYTHHMSRGQRVLAMAYRDLGRKKTVASLKEQGRDFIEQGLTFAGFLVLDCPLKSDSKSVITELRKSGHDVVMITGDAILTATEVARQVGIIREKKSNPGSHVIYELRERQTSDSSESADDEMLSKFAFSPLVIETQSAAKTLGESISLSPSNIRLVKEMVSKSKASVCVTGESLTKIAVAVVQYNVGKDSWDESMVKSVLLHPSAQELLKDLVPLISVFARHAPRQKEAVVHAFNLGGYHTLMCGDGTNDVGALKRAHVGISIISAPELEAKQRKATAKMAKLKAEEKQERKNKNKKSKIKSSADKKSRQKARNAALHESLRQIREAQEELDGVELGDASVASPFTSRAMSIKCCKDVLQQGRCTLVTMLTIYKILGVSCLVNALVLSKLHSYGVKQGDRQLTALGMAVAVMFLFVTRGKPLPTLSPDRPPSSVLCMQALLSIAGQFLVHFAAIIIVTHSSLAYVDPWDPSMIPDGPFNPNVLNTCTFLLTILATVNTFVVNYPGEPFMEGLRENTLLIRSVQICYGALVICSLEIFWPLNDLLQLSPLPDTSALSNEDGVWVPPALQEGDIFVGIVHEFGFPISMCALMVADTILVYMIEKSIASLFKTRSSDKINLK